MRQVALRFTFQNLNVFPDFLHKSEEPAVGIEGEENDDDDTIDSDYLYNFTRKLSTHCTW